MEELLKLGNSAWRVNAAHNGLERRLDETVTTAAGTVIASASAEASGHLVSAWKSAYGRSPDPDKVYSEAVHAVEALACPLVLGKAAEKNKATLGGVIEELGSSSQ